jgi:hypothetical protein
LLFIKVNKTTIVVISAQARFISDMFVLLLGWFFACYGPSAFYLAVVEQNADVFFFGTHAADLAWNESTLYVKTVKMPLKCVLTSATVPNIREDFKVHLFGAAFVVYLAL